jgi:hypothetical protein
MLETTNLYLSSTKTRPRPSAIRFIVMAFIAFSNLSLAPLAWSQLVSEPFDPVTLKIGIALAQPAIIDPDAELLAMNFVRNVLPNLVGGDAALARHVGFSSPEDFNLLQEFGAKLGTPLPYFVVDLNDLLEFIKGKTHPLSLLVKDANWLDFTALHVRPRRFVFPIHLNDPNTDDTIPTKSSVVIEKTPLRSWLVHQAGAPTLIRTVKTYSRNNLDFLVWIPAINRHYLGRIGPDFRLKMTVLFDDPLAQVKAGHEFDPQDSEVIDKLKKLANRLYKQLNANSANTKGSRGQEVPTAR